ncbi:MAG: DUF5606 domain-containing protein [Bacteroidales bacterium]|nr:DUF5606 domain-containing protein [Bacteroidales bacterium]
MDLKEILAISGKPGLYKFISQGRNAMIVENIEDNSRTSAFATEKVSALEDIAIFTEEEEVSLRDVLKKIFEKENEGEAISHKANSQELKKWFEEVLPTYDKDRVYVSDIKKVALWYNLLCKMKMLDFTEDEEESKEKEVDETVEKTEAPSSEE